MLVLVLVGAGTAAGVIATRSPAGGYTSIAWTRGQYTQMRYCQGPNPYLGNFLAASAGVTCGTARAIIATASAPSRCIRHVRCEADSFRCAGYFGGKFGTLTATDHLLCSENSRRVAWDGG